jgi:hypothetical protein
MESPVFVLLGPKESSRPRRGIAGSSMRAGGGAGQARAGMSACQFSRSIVRLRIAALVTATRPVMQ